MTPAEMKAGIAAAHQRQFGSPPQATAWAPGRVNLLGEHTDYNGGYVLPIALRSLGVSVAASADGTPGVLSLRSETFDQVATRSVDEAGTGHWSDYVLGCALAVARDRIADGGLCLTLDTTLPLGAGLSSSAALEVATLRALDALYGLGLTPVEIAVTARAVENGFIGVPCGIMDQFASSVGTPGQAIFLETATLDYRAAPSLAGHAFVVIDSGVSHQLSDGGYAQRVAECRAAAEALGVSVLSELGPDDMARIESLPEPLVRRARHIVTDNRLARAGLDALEQGRAQDFGRLMVESHASARDDYRITVPQTDALAAAAVEAGALGARQTGGGWGGSVVGLVALDRVDEVCRAATAAVPGSRLLAVT